MVGCCRCPQRCHGVVNVVLRQRDNVHIAFNNKQSLRFSVMLLSFIKAIQLSTFMENIGFRGVQVFRRIVTEYATTKTNHPSSFIANREHHPITETIVGSALVIVDQHSGIQ